MPLIEKLQAGTVAGHQLAAAVLVWFELPDGVDADAERAKIGDWFGLDAGELATLDGFRATYQGLPAAGQRHYAVRVDHAAQLLQFKRTQAGGGVEYYFDGADAIALLNP